VGVPPRDPAAIPHQSVSPTIHRQTVRFWSVRGLSQRGRRAGLDRADRRATARAVKDPDRRVRTGRFARQALTMTRRSTWCRG
jgi:hypothetical protein